MKFGATAATSRPMMTTTTMISSNVKPCSAPRRGGLITRITSTSDRQGLKRPRRFGPKIAQEVHAVVTPDRSSEPRFGVSIRRLRESWVIVALLAVCLLLGAGGDEIRELGRYE